MLRAEDNGGGEPGAAAGERHPTGARRPEPADLTAAVEAAREGDEEAFRTLFRALQPGLLRYLRTLVGEDAEDVASEAWLQVARDLGRFRGDSDGFRGWVATVARNRALDHLRSRQRRPRTGLPVEYLDGLPARDDTAGAVLDSAAASEAVALIARLPRDQAEAVLLRVVVDLDAETAARVLGKRPGAVRTAAHRGLRRLAALLGTPGDGAGDRAEPPAPEEAAKKVRRKSRAGVTRKQAPTLKDMR
ncbi:RNA polymerase sigma factor [Streptomyces sp. NPDC001380]|uniref:RNA polymerase sigma factor n=1 Tax=Streptomyces sp. NPDC001380 TaxID=3364566 RepID=UPI00368003A7